MNAIFDTEQEAQDYADRIQGFLCRTRPGYMDNGTYRWADPQKHPTEEQWAVPMPPEEVTTPIEKVALVEKLDESWAAVEAGGLTLGQ
jgi:hypothetical protein